jgi:hypothetical protein
MTPAEQRRADEEEAAKAAKCPFCRARAGQWCTTYGRYSGGARRSARIHQARMKAWREAREAATRE